MLESIPIDERRILIIPGDFEATTLYAIEHWRTACLESVRERGEFYVALSGGSTPKAIFEKLTRSPYREEIPWEKIHFFWSDERCVPSDHPESNYHMAMESGLKNIGLPASHIHRMPADATDITESAKRYQEEIQLILKNRPFDLIMLGMGDDGHTASLFPHTLALKNEVDLVVSNHVPQKDTWRMTLTYSCINAARKIAIYVLGAAKASMLNRVLKGAYDPIEWPSQKVGTSTSKAFWIADTAAISSFKY